MAFHDCQPLQEFLDELRQRKVHYQWAWETRRDNKAPRQPRGAGKDSTYPDIGMLLFTGEGFQPSVLTAIVIDYGKNGFGLYTETGDHTILGDIERIATPAKD